MRSTFLLILFSLIIQSSITAQESDTIPKPENAVSDTIICQHSPQKATLYSMVLPGLGQAYNKKYWKIPIVYAGFATLTYFIVTNGNEYRKYRQAYDYVTIGDQSIPINNDYVGKYEPEQLAQGRDYYRRNLEFTYILTGLWYILNVVDAAVDAHLYDYDIDDDLGLRIAPVLDHALITPKVHPGVSLTFKF